MAERIGKSDLFNPYTPPDTPMRKPTDTSQVVRRKEKKSHSPLATLLTEVPDVAVQSPFHVTTAKPLAVQREVNKLHACSPGFGQPDNDDDITPKHPQGKVVGQPSSIPELQKDITAKIEDEFMQRMSIAMERAFGHFLDGSKGSIMSMMGEPQGCVIKPPEAGNNAGDSKANTDYANMGNNYTGTYTAIANDAYATVANDSDANVSADAPYPKSSSMATAANQQSDLVPALTTALTAALVTLQKPAPEPTPRGSRIKLGRYDGLTSWETYYAQFELLAAANNWSPAERAVQLVSALEGEARRVLLDVTAADLGNPQAIFRALKRRFGSTTPAVVMRQRFNDRVRESGEKLGVFAAELRYLAQRGFPDFDDATRLVLTKEAFIRGLLPLPLRQQVRLADPQTLEAALDKALAVEDILTEGLDYQTRQVSVRPRTQAVQSPGPTSYSTGSERKAMSPDDRQSQVCWKCHQRGHIWRLCTVPDSALQAPGNAQGSV